MSRQLLALLVNAIHLSLFCAYRTSVLSAFAHSGDRSSTKTTIIHHAPSFERQRTADILSSRYLSMFQLNMKEGGGQPWGEESSQMSAATKPIRRQRYSGKYPKQFQEKYKEIAGNSTVMAKVISKGGTPVGSHIPIMLRECLEHLGLGQENRTLRQGHIVVDCTLGYGGHSEAILKRIVRQKGLLIAFDQDSIELEKTKDRLQLSFFQQPNCQKFLNSANLQPSDVFQTINDNFCNVEKCLSELLPPSENGFVDGLLADLGCSSMQIDNPSRGFTYKSDGPLDMRMNSNQQKTALTVLQENTKESLADILLGNSDESLAVYIAASIYDNMEKQSQLPQTTGELSQAVRRGVQLGHNALKMSYPTKQDMDKAIVRTMQAIRIEVNQEFDSLDRLLESLPRLLRPGGRAAVLTFHSGEDRRVKKSFKQGFNEGVYSAWSRDVLRAEPSEQFKNPRSKCAKLRWVIKAEK